MLEYFVIALTLFLSSQATPTGNHTCTGVIKHEVTVRVNVTEPVTFRAYEWCLRVPPRCSTYTIQLKDRVKIHKEMHNRTITVCCKGYVEIDYKCVPACPPDVECPNMHCNRTNHCYCTPGYTGLYCNHPCPKGVWGAGCIKPCDCPTGYTCHYLTGDCMIDDSPPSKTRRTTTVAELLTEVATTLMTTHPTTRIPTTLRTTPLPTTTSSTTTTPPTTTTVATSTTYGPTTRSTRASSTTTTQSTTPEVITAIIIPTITTSTSTTPPPPTTTITEGTTATTRELDLTTHHWEIVDKSENTTSTISTSIPQNTEEVAKTVTTTRATTVGTTEITITTGGKIPLTVATTAAPKTTVITSITDMPSTTSTTALYSDIVPPIITTSQSRYMDDIATATTTGLPTTTILQQEGTEAKTDTTQPTLITSQPFVPLLQERETTSPIYHEQPSSSTTRTPAREEPTAPPPSTHAPTTLVYTTPTTTTIMTTTTEKPTTRAETTTTERITTVTQTPIEDFSTTQQVTTAKHLLSTATVEKNPIAETTRADDWVTLDKEIESSRKIKMQVDDLFFTQPTATSTPTIDPLVISSKSTLTSAVFDDIKPSTSSTTKGVEQFNEERNDKEVGGLPEQGTAEETVHTSTTDRLDRLIIEDVPEAPLSKVTTDDNPIKIAEEVMSKYFPNTFLKAAIEPTNNPETLPGLKKEGNNEKPLLPTRKMGEGPPTRIEVEDFDERSRKVEDVVKPTSPLPTTEQPTTVTTSFPLTEASTMAIITPKVIVSAKNPDEIDLGGVIYRKMKLFPPVKPLPEYTTVPTLDTPLVTQSMEPSNKEAPTTPVSDRFKIYLPEYDKEAEEFDTTETPNIKTFLPKFNFDKEEFDYGKQAQVKKAKQKEKDLKKYKVKPHEVTSAPVEDGSNERVTNNVFLETKEFKVHLASTKSQKFGEYTKAPSDQDSPIHDLNKLAKKKSKFGSGEYEPTRYVKQTIPAEGQNFDEVGTTQAFLETNNPTTNAKPPHTWYSHAREKAKIKSALKIMKSTMTLDMTMKPTVDSMMEESNDINSMATQYTDREPRAAVAAAVTYQDDLSNPQMFGQVKFNAPEGYAAASVSGGGNYDGMPLGMLSSVAVGGACFMTMASLLAVLWLRLKTRRSQMRKTETTQGLEERPPVSTSTYETVYPIHRVSDELEVATFFCPTFTNRCAERINRELNELSYDHPRRSFADPLYAEVLHPKLRFPEEDDL